MGEAGVRGRRNLPKRSGQHANIHLVLLGSPHWLNNLAIHEYLRTHLGEVAAYVEPKEAIVASGAERSDSHFSSLPKVLSSEVDDGLAAGG
jgi:hypothetical protein